MSAWDDTPASPAAAQAPVSAWDATPSLTPQQVRDVQAKQDVNASIGRLGDLLYGGGMGAADLVQGVGQKVLHGAQWLYDQLGKNGQGQSLATGPAGQALNSISQGLDQAVARREAIYQADTPGSFAAGLGRTITNTAPFLAAPEGAVASGRGLLSRLLQSGTQGAGLGLTQPVTQDTDNFGLQAAKQGLTGAVGGTGGTVLGSVFGRAISPKVAPEVRSLLDQGVTPTVGQIMGGIPGALENKLTSLPIVGDMIKNAQRRGVEDFNLAGYDRALNPIGLSAEQLGLNAGREGVGGVKQALSDAYNNVLPNLTYVHDKQAMADFAQLHQMAQNLPPPQAQQFQKILYNIFESKLGPQGSMDGTALKGALEGLSDKAKGYGSSGDPDQRDLGKAFGQAVANIRSSLQRTNPMYAEALKNIDQGYANYATLRRAASSTAAPNGVFTPSQLQTAIRAQDQSAGKGNFATGNALMQDLADAGKNVMPTYPDSGTVGRGLAIASPMVATGAMTKPLATAAGVGAGGLAMLPYTGVGQKVLAAALTKRPANAPALAQAVRDASPAVGAALTPALLQALKNYSN